MRSFPRPFGSRASVRRVLNAALCVAIGLVLVLLAPHVLSADPVIIPVPICTAPGDQLGPVIASDGADGAFIAWTDFRDGWDVLHLYVQRLLASGEIAPGWPADGVPVCTISQVFDVVMCADGAGGAFLAWEDSRFQPDEPGGGSSVYAQHVLGSGEIDPAWPRGGLLLRQSYGHWWYCKYPAIVANGAGGAIVTWQFHSGLYHGDDVNGCILQASGPTAYFGIMGASTCRTVAPDGAGGGIVVFTNWVSPTYVRMMLAQHVLASGAVDPAWPAEGTPLCSSQTLYGGPQAVSDGEAGAIVAWWDARSDEGNIYVQRVGANGAVMWDTAGVALCAAAGAQQYPMITPDCTNGALVVWQDARSGANDIYVRRVDSSGSPLGTADGIAVCREADEQTFPVIASNGTCGALVAWTDHRSGTENDIYGQRLSPWAQPVCTLNGEPLCTSHHDQSGPVIVSAGLEGAIVAWEDCRSGSDWDIYARRIWDAPTDVTASLVSAGFEDGAVRLRWRLAGDRTTVALHRRTDGGPWLVVASLVPDGTGDVTYADTDVQPGQRYGYRLDLGAGSMTSEVWVEVPAPALALLGTRPNPVVGRPSVVFSQPDGGPARLELFDVGGRLRGAREVGSLGPGEHVVTLDEGEPLPPGIYLIRLTHAQRTLVARAVVMK